MHLLRLQDNTISSGWEVRPWKHWEPWMISQVGHGAGVGEPKPLTGTGLTKSKRD